jgi:hypothetical protein
MRYETNPEWKCIIRHNEDGSVSSIPIDLANADYQEYLKAQQDTEIA